MNNLRVGYDLIIKEIPRQSRVLDLGCGDGMLLKELEGYKKVDGHGVEISAEGVSLCLEKGLYCFQGDILSESKTDCQTTSDLLRYK